MKYPLYLTDEQVSQLEYEVLSRDFYSHLTRKLLYWCEEVEYMEHVLMRKNKLINLSRNISGGLIYKLESDDMGHYEDAEYAWHDSNFLLIFRELSTVQFIEFACELFRLGHLKIDYVNQLLKKEGASFSFSFNRRTIEVDVLTVEELEDEKEVGEHLNIRTLVNRMETAYQVNDYSGVLHASASIFETMAKDIIGIPAIQDKTLKSFFDRYRNDSNLPEEILDYILITYEKRNTEPLAGHGSLSIPNVTQEDAIILSEMTKAFIRIEYRMKSEV